MCKIFTFTLLTTLTAALAAPTATANDQGVVQAYCLLVVNFPDLGTPNLEDCLHDATTEKYDGMVCLRSKLGTCVDEEWILRRVLGFVNAVGKDLAWGKPASPKFEELPFVIADGEMHSGLGFLSTSTARTTTTGTASSGDEGVIAEIKEIDDKIRVDQEREKLEAAERSLDTAKAETQGLHIGIKIALFFGGAAFNLVVIGVCQWCHRRTLKRDFQEFKASMNTTPTNNAVLQNVVTQV